MVSRLVGGQFSKAPCEERRGKGLVSNQSGGVRLTTGYIIACALLSIWAVTFPFWPNGPISWHAPIWQGLLLCWLGDHHTVTTAGCDRFQEFRNCSWHDGRHFYVLASGIRHFLYSYVSSTASPALSSFNLSLPWFLFTCGTYHHMSHILFSYPPVCNLFEIPGCVCFVYNRVSCPKDLVGAP